MHKEVLLLSGIVCGSEIDAEFDIFWQKTAAGIVSIQPCSNAPNTTGEYLFILCCKLFTKVQFSFCYFASYLHAQE